MTKLQTEYRRAVQEIKRFVCGGGNVKWVFLILVLCYLAAISAILRANFTYMDDILRKVWFYRNFGFNRYLSNFLSIFVHGDTLITDISPGPQVIAVLLIALASLILLLTFSRDKKLGFWDIAAVLPLGISPYFMECFSYKFDSPYMALSVLASVMPLLVQKAHSVVYVAAVAISALVVCTTYQASSGIFPMVVIFLVCRMWCENESLKKIFLLVIHSVAGYLLGLIIFRMFIMIPIDGYVSTSMFSLRDLPSGAFQNLKHYYRQIVIDFDIKWLICIGLITVGYVAYSAFHSRRNKLLSFFVVGMGVIFAAVLAFGAYIALQKPLYECRAMLGFGALIALLGINTVNQKHTMPVKLTCVCLSWLFIVFSLTYGNALAEHQRYVDFRIETTIQELNDLEVMQSREPAELQISGDIGDSPVITRMNGCVPMLDRLIQSGFRGGDWEFNYFYFFKYFGLENLTRVSDLDEAGMTLVKPGFYQDIYVSGNQILVKLKDPMELR